jgi:hypothetical protein
MAKGGDMEPRNIMTGSEHYDVHRERSRGWSAVIAGACFAVLLISGVAYALAVRGSSGNGSGGSGYWTGTLVMEATMAKWAPVAEDRAEVL